MIHCGSEWYSANSPVLEDALFERLGMYGQRLAQVGPGEVHGGRSDGHRGRSLFGWLIEISFAEHGKAFAERLAACSV